MSNARKTLKRRLFKRDGPLCAFGCGTVLTHETATIDHYPIPRRLGGPWTLENTRLACQPCNSGDGGRPELGGATEVIPQGLSRPERRAWWLERERDSWAALLRTRIGSRDAS